MRDEVRLREVVPADVDVFYEHQLDPDAVRLAVFRSRERTAFLNHWSRIMADPSVEKRTILCGSEVAGNIVSFGEQSARELALLLGRDFWGRGVATRALSMFLAEVATRPLISVVGRHNEPALRVLTRSGFKVAGEETGLAVVDGRKIEGLILRLD